MKDYMYIVMLVFQLAGAIVLLFNCINGSQKRIIKNCFPGSNVAKRDENNNCTIEKADLQKSAMKVYPNIIAFADLVIGYGIAAVNPQVNDADSYRVIKVIAGAILLAVLEFLLCKAVSKIKFSRDKLISYSELEKNGVDTVLTEKEIDELLKD